MGITACFTSIPANELQRLRGDPDELEAFLYPEGGDGEPPHYLDIDKAWHGLHYLFTGEAEGGAEPLSLSILGGTELGDEMDYGPARFLEAEAVPAVAQFYAGAARRGEAVIQWLS